jgi:hypothetical protein
VQEWAKRLPRQLRCPACNDHHWELRSLDDILGKPANDPAAIPPVITIMCTCCGHLGFFDSKAMGL